MLPTHFAIGSKQQCRVRSFEQSRAGDVLQHDEAQQAAARGDVVFRVHGVEHRRALHHVGVNFGAGMTGGMAFVYDPTDIFKLKVNPETVAWQRIDHPHWENVMKELVEEHVAETKSPLGARLLNDWDREIEKVWQVVPKEMLSRLPVPLSTAKAKTA